MSVNILPCFLSLQYNTIATGSADMKTLSIMASPMSWISPSVPLWDYSAQSCSFCICGTLAYQVPMNFKIIHVLRDIKNEPMICFFYILTDICVFWNFLRHCLESYGSYPKFIILCHWAKCPLRGRHFSPFWGENSSLCGWQHSRYLYLAKRKGIALH